MSGKMCICKKSFVTLGWSRALLPGDTAGMASLTPTVPRALRGAAKKLLAKECSHHLTFSLFQIFSWKQMTCMEWKLPFQCHKTGQCWETQGADLLALCCSSPTQRVSIDRITWRWPHQGDFSLCSPLKMLFPARVPFSVYPLQWKYEVFSQIFLTLL